MMIIMLLSTTFVWWLMKFTSFYSAYYKWYNRFVFIVNTNNELSSLCHLLFGYCLNCLSIRNCTRIFWFCDENALRISSKDLMDTLQSLHLFFSNIIFLTSYTVSVISKHLFQYIYICYIEHKVSGMTFILIDIIITTFTLLYSCTVCI